MTVNLSVASGEHPIEAIQRACRMILVEAGLTTVQADRIREHVQTILIAAAEQERQILSPGVPWDSRIREVAPGR